MGKIKGYARSSDIMQVNISFGKEQFVFNLYDEIKVSEAKINSEIMEQPTSYSFLMMLQKKLIHSVEDAEMQMEKKYYKTYNKYKEIVNENTGRIYDKEYANAIAMANPIYLERKAEWVKLKADLGIITTCVKSFEQRAFLIQTLSANIRKDS